MDTSRHGPPTILSRSLTASPTSVIQTVHATPHLRHISTARMSQYRFSYLSEIERYLRDNQHQLTQGSVESPNRISHGHSVLEDPMNSVRPVNEEDRGIRCGGFYGYQLLNVFFEIANALFPEGSGDECTTGVLMWLAQSMLYQGVFRSDRGVVGSEGWDVSEMYYLNQPCSAKSSDRENVAMLSSSVIVELESRGDFSRGDGRNNGFLTIENEDTDDCSDYDVTIFDRPLVAGTTSGQSNQDRRVNGPCSGIWIPWTGCFAPRCIGKGCYSWSCRKRYETRIESVSSIESDGFVT
jgi:hypothetical protein